MKYTVLDDKLFDYLRKCRSNAADQVLDALRKETEALGDSSRMKISEEQGSFMSIVVAAIGARSAIELGTFTGYSSICIARALPAGGKLICIDMSKEWTDIARKYWKLAGLEQKLELQLTPAIPYLKRLPSET